DLAKQTLDERRLAGAVGADDADAIAARDRQIEPVEESLLVVLLGESLHHHALIARALRGRQPQVHHLEFDRALVDVLLEAIEARLASLGLAGPLAGAGAGDQLRPLAEAVAPRVRHVLA